MTLGRNLSIREESGKNLFPEQRNFGERCPLKWKGSKTDLQTKGLLEGVPSIMEDSGKHFLCKERSLIPCSVWSRGCGSRPKRQNVLENTFAASAGNIRNKCQKQILSEQRNALEWQLFCSPNRNQISNETSNLGILQILFSELFWQLKSIGALFGYID